MYIKEIELKNYRNYEYLKIEFNEKTNLILGNNAEGKTNLLESIYLSSIGRSFRTNKDSDLVQFNRDAAKVSVKAEKNYGETTVEITIKKDSKKSVKKDGVNIKKASELLENILIVIFSPEDLKIVKDEPEKRRKFIDRELSQILPSYYDALSNYKKILIQRNTYLKEENVEISLLDLWDVQLAKYGSRIMRAREKFIRKLNVYSSRIHESITNGREKLELVYEPDIELHENLEDNYYLLLKDNLANDLKKRNTGIGPHRDDLAFFVNGINMRNFGSQGQQRTCALSIKLAELNLIKEETDEDAILLLDDVMSELDVERQEYLIKTLKNNQLFITTTDVEKRITDSLPEGKVMYVKQGTVSEEK